MNSGKINSKRDPRGYRHTDDSINHFAMSTLLLGGTRNYEITHANSGGGMPSTKTVRRKLAQFDQSAEEGARNVRLLKDYLDSNNYPPIVCLSTDATQIIPR